MQRPQPDLFWGPHTGSTGAAWPHPGTRANAGSGHPSPSPCPGLRELTGISRRAWFSAFGRPFFFPSVLSQAGLPGSKQSEACPGTVCPPRATGIPVVRGTRRLEAGTGGGGREGLFPQKHQDLGQALHSPHPSLPASQPRPSLTQLRRVLQHGQADLLLAAFLPRPTPAGPV